MVQIKASVIVSTYNQPEWLEKVLWGYNIQTTKDFEIIIADDGSSKETKLIIEKFIASSTLFVKHIWHEDAGFRKTKILNKAVLETSSDYLIFTDGDCIPREDFVETHLRLRRKNCFLSGGYFKIPEQISKIISMQDIDEQNCFKINWLLDRGLKKSFKVNKLTAQGIKQKLLNTFTPTKATFDGMNVSGWKEGVLIVNGFDERMEYGGEDREIGERLMHSGYKFLQIRYSAICIHLHHERPYRNEETILKNKDIRLATKKNKSTFTPFGIQQ